jgi:hypothetical protein
MTLKDAIAKVAKELGRASFHDEMGGGHGQSHLTASEVLAAAFGGKEKSIRERLRPQVEAERKRLFEQQRASFRRKHGE